MVAERLRERLEAADVGPAGPVTASLGVAEFRSQSGTSALLLERVDTALYAAKRVVAIGSWLPGSRNACRAWKLHQHAPRSNETSGKPTESLPPPSRRILCRSFPRHPRVVVCSRSDGISSSQE